MPRTLTTAMVTALTSQNIVPAFLAQLTFTTGTAYVWSGIGPLVWGGNTYQGIGSLGKVGDVVEGIEVRADGASVTLSGIDSALLQESLADIQMGAPAALYFALVSGGALIGNPYPLFVGVISQPSVTAGPDKMAITLALESKMINHSRPTSRRYTSADQNFYFPGDSGFAFVELLNDIALIWK